MSNFTKITKGYSPNYRRSKPETSKSEAYGNRKKEEVGKPDILRE